MASLLPLVTVRGAAAMPLHVQAKQAYVGSGRSVSTTLSPTTSGNLLAVYVVWSNTGNASVTDNRGNTYTSATLTKTTWASNYSAQVFYAKNISGGTPTVKVTFNNSVSFGILYVHEYSGLDKTNPLDASKAAKGTGTALDSGAVTTTAPNDLVFGGGASVGAVSSGGAGFTVRSLAEGNITEDKIAGAAGSYSATATHGGGGWVMQVAAFKADTPIDTTAPSIPTNLSATSNSTTTVNLSWTASTDNIGVTGYKIFRNGTQVATTVGSTYQDTGLNASTTYNYTVSAFDAAGNNSAQSASVAGTTQTPDTEAPSVPADLASTSVGETQVGLSWSASIDNVGVNGYKVFRDGVQVGTSGTTTFQNTGLSAGTTYNYTVAAYDAAGNVSAQSAPLAVTTMPPDTQAPTAPADLTATALSPTEIDLNWAAAADNVGVTGYRVFRDAILVDTTTATSYQDLGLQPNTTYTYKVVAYDAAGNDSEASTPASAATPADTQAPTQPGNLTATTPSSTQAQLSWTASTDNVGVSSYQISRNGTIVNTTTSTTFTDNNLTPGTTYNYSVVALDAAGNASTPATATITLPAANDCSLPKYPDQNCTGVPVGTQLTTYSGPTTIATANTVIDGKIITSCITVTAPGVVIKNSRISCNPSGSDVILSPDGVYLGTPLLIEDSEISCNNTNSTGIGDTNFIARRVDVSGCENGFDLDQLATVEDSYIHELYNGGTDPHTDGIQLAYGHCPIQNGQFSPACTGSTVVANARDITIRHNTIYDYNRVDHQDGTSAIISNHGQDVNVLIQDNLMAGGAYSLYCDQRPPSNPNGPQVTGINYRVINNHFSIAFHPTVAAYGPSTECSDETQSGNMIHETGQQLTLN